MNEVIEEHGVVDITESTPTTYSYTPATVALDLAYQAACLIINSAETAQNQFVDNATGFHAQRIATAAGLILQWISQNYSSGLTNAEIDAGLGVTAGSVALVLAVNSKL